MLFEELLASLEGAAPRRVALAGADSVRGIEAMARARDLGLVVPVLCGDEGAIREAAGSAGVGLDGVEIVHAADFPERVAAAMVGEGRAQVLMKGSVSTGAFLKALLDRASGLRAERPLSHMAVFHVPALGRALYLTDSGLNPYPDLDRKVAILENAIAFLGELGISQPRVAVLSSTETPTGSLPCSMDAARIRELARGGAFGGALVDGPLALDLAVSQEACDEKGFSSPVGGEADVLLCPDVVAGNILGKSMIYMAGAAAAGVVLGARAPVVMLSRSDSPDTRLHSLALALACQRGSHGR